jgi:hypothetical protein
MTITVGGAAICQGRRRRGSEGIVMVRHLRHAEIDDGPSAAFTEQYLLDRLMAAGIGCLEDWCALSPRARRNIFGITSGMAQAIDRMAKARRK